MFVGRTNVFSPGRALLIGNTASRSIVVSFSLSWTTHWKNEAEIHLMNAMDHFSITRYHSHTPDEGGVSF
jgi:hypothetical protein